MENLKQLFSSLSGKKTYIGVLAGAVVYFASGMGWLPESVSTGLYTLVGAWTGVAFRQAITKAAK